MARSFTRRWFIGGMAGCGASAGLRALAAPGVSSASGGVRLRIGIVSDVHLGAEGEEAALENALAHFRAAGVDGVVVPGDIAHLGRIDQLRLFARCWHSAFPDGKGADGRRVEPLFVYGNHDIDGFKFPKNEARFKDNPGRLAAEAIGHGDNRARFWRETFHEDFAPIWMKNVKGYTFIGAHWNRANGGIPVEDFMKSNGAKIDPSLPFFYIQHEHPRDTCIGPWAWGHDDGRATRALAPFPNAVALSGHSHYTLTDERSVWQGAFTSINAGSLKYSSYDYALRENMTGNGYGYRADRQRKRAMSRVDTTNGKQGMLMTVCEDRIVLERREFVSGKSLGDDWVIPLPCANEKPFAFAARARKRVAPEFADGAKAGAAKEKSKTAGSCIAVRFPPARTQAKCRVFEYEVTATLIADDVDLVQLQRRVFAPDFHLPETDKGVPGVCLIPEGDLPMKGRYRFDVRPVECFGHKGRAISAELVV